MAKFRSFILLLVFAFAAFSQEPSAPPPAFQNVGTMSQLMVNMIYPASDAIFYVERAPPKNDHDWGGLQYQALVLAESANLLMMPGRARDQDKWIKDAKLMLEVGAAAYKATKAKDLDAVIAVSDALNTACIQCHQDYRPAYRRRLPAKEPEKKE